MINWQKLDRFLARRGDSMQIVHLRGKIVLDNLLPRFPQSSLLNISFESRFLTPWFVSHEPWRRDAFRIALFPWTWSIGPKKSTADKSQLYSSNAYHLLYKPIFRYSTFVFYLQLSSSIEYLYLADKPPLPCLPKYFNVMCNSTNRQNYLYEPI